MSLEKAKKEIEQKIDDFAIDHGYHEPDTGVFVFNDFESAFYVEGLSDALEILEKHLET